MSLRAQVLFWLAALLAAVGLLWLLQGILLPFLVGMAIAYFLDPVADRLERLGLSRLAATTLITILFFAAVIVAIVILAPLVQEQIVNLMDTLPTAFERLRRTLVHIGHTRWGTFLGTNRMSSANIANELGGWVANLLGRAWAGGLALVNALSLIVVTPVVAFYLLLDWDRMIARVDTWLPRRQAPTIRRLAGEINHVLAGYVRGQGLLMIALAVFYAVGLTAVGLNFGLLIGLVSGLISFMPFLGAIAGFVVSMAVALVQFWPNWLHVALVMAVFLVGQALEGNVLQPRLVGRQVGLHPVWVIFAVLAFGLLFGFVGMLLAVPLAAAIRVLLRFFLNRYMESPLYTGAPEPEAVEPTLMERDTGPRRVADL